MTEGAPRSADTAPKPRPMQQRVIAWDTRQTSRSAVVGVILSTVWLFGLGSIAGILLGLQGLNDTRDGRQRGDGLAVAAITIGILRVIPLAFAIWVYSQGIADPVPSYTDPYCSAYSRTLGDC